MLQHGRENHVFVENITHFQKCVGCFEFIEIEGSVQTVFELAVMSIEPKNEIT